MGSSTEVEQCAEILEEACARNQPVELHHVSATDELLIARARILNLDEKHVYLDSPQSTGQPVNFARNNAVSVYLQIRGKRYTFKSRVAKAHCRVSINARMQVPGIALARPRVVDEGQRREDFRISVACLDEITVRLHEVEDEEAAACPVDAKRFTSRLVDISRGGVCVLVPVEEHRSLQTGEHLCATVELPRPFARVTLLVQVRHFRQVCHDEVSRIGLKFIPWAPRMTRPFAREVARFCADLERRAAHRPR